MPIVAISLYVFLHPGSYEGLSFMVLIRYFANSSSII